MFYFYIYKHKLIIIILFIVQCRTQSSKPEPLKQDTQKKKIIEKKINLYSILKNKFGYIQKHNLNETQIKHNMIYK